MEQQDQTGLQWRTRALSALLPAFAVLLVVFEFFDANGMMEPAPGSEPSLAAALSGGLFAFAFLACVVMSAMWLHKANANLRAAGIEMTHSPSWSWGWYFIPIANLYKPYQAMREIWNESHRLRDTFAANDEGLLRIWWGCWIVGNIVSNVSSRLATIAGGRTFIVLNVIEAITLGAAALLLLRIVREVTAAQADLGKASVFD
jgi:hypothetical protein